MLVSVKIAASHGDHAAIAPKPSGVGSGVAHLNMSLPDLNGKNWRDADRWAQPASSPTSLAATASRQGRSARCIHFNESAGEFSQRFRTWVRTRPFILSRGPQRAKPQSADSTWSSQRRAPTELRVRTPSVNPYLHWRTGSWGWPGRIKKGMVPPDSGISIFIPWRRRG